MHVGVGLQGGKVANISMTFPRALNATDRLLQSKREEVLNQQKSLPAKKN
jgi:hypothetical protein